MFGHFSTLCNKGLTKYKSDRLIRTHVEFISLHMLFDVVLFFATVGVANGDENLIFTAAVVTGHVNTVFPLISAAPQISAAF